LERPSNRQGLDQSAITTKLDVLKVKRQRVLDAFFEGVIEKPERDRKLAGIRDESESYQKLLLESAQLERPCAIEELEKVLEPFAEWEFLEREDKRALLALICPEIRVFQYRVKSLVLRFGVPTGDSYNGSRLKTGA
jgi:hypothetical protein